MLLLQALFCHVTFCHFGSLFRWPKQQIPAAPFLLSQCFGAVSSQQAQLSFSYQSKVLVKHCSGLWTLTSLEGGGDGSIPLVSSAHI